MRCIGAVLPCLLAGCSRDQPASPARLRAAADFAGPEAEAIEVRVSGIPPGTKIERILLLGPDGERLEGPELVRSISEVGPDFVNRTGIGIGVQGGSSSGIRQSFSLNRSLAREPGHDRQTRQISAQIVLPDPAAYRATADAWRVELHYSDVTGARRVLGLPAPSFR